MLELHSESQGAGEPLLLVHGLFGSATNWRGIARRLGEQRRALAVDLRNHGRSPHHPAMDYPHMAQDLDAFIACLDAGPVDVLGHSMGGKAAMLLALTRPDRIRRLVVVDIAPVGYGHSHADLVSAMQKVDLAGIKSRTEADRQLQSAVPETGVRLFLLQNLALAQGRYHWRLNLAALAEHMRDIIGFPDVGSSTFSGPTLFINGERSDYILPEHRDLIHRYFPAACFETIAGAGHWVHADQPDALIDSVLDFLD